MCRGFRSGFFVRSLVAMAAAGLLTAGPAMGQEVQVESGDERVTVTVDGELFTEYLWDGDKPILYPVHGPHGIRMVRHFPMQEGVEGEAEDHPHQQSLWWAHGDINGEDYWHHGGTYRTDDVEVIEEGERGAIRVRHTLLDAEGEPLGQEVRTIAFHGEGQARFIDLAITVTASEVELVMGETKEGTMGIRTHPNLRLDRGADAMNSEGISGPEVWGKRASWVDYWGEIDGEVVGVAIFDHPDNPRHPTWWHARHYGLIAANPFGDPGFEGESQALVIPEGHSVTFQYRFYFHEGDWETAQTAERYEAYATQASE